MMNDELNAKKFAALAHSVRLAIIRMLLQAGPPGLPAGKLGDPLGIAPSALTFHLQKLAHVGLVSSRREGQFVIYAAAFTDLLDLVDNLVGTCCADTQQKCGPRCPTCTCGAASTAISLNHPEGIQND